MFPTLDVNDVSEILSGNSWDMEASFEAALALSSSRDIIEEEYIVRDRGMRVARGVRASHQQQGNDTDALPSKTEVRHWTVPSNNADTNTKNSTNTNSKCDPSFSSSSSSSSSSSLSWPSINNIPKLSNGSAITSQDVRRIISMYREAAAAERSSPDESNPVKCR